MAFQLRFAPTFRKCVDEMRAQGDPFAEDLQETWFELGEKPFHNPKLQTHQLKGAPRGTYTTDVGGRRSDRRIAWRLIGRTIVLLLYGTHQVQQRACRMTLEIDDETETLRVHEAPLEGGPAQPSYQPPQPVGRSFQIWTNAELAAMGFGPDEVDALRAADTEDEVLDLSVRFGERVYNLFVFGHVDGEEAALADSEAQLVEDPDEPAPTAEDLELERLIEDPRLADEFLAVSAEIAAEVLSKPVEDWMIYLHPEQLPLTYRQFDGPARIHGASGTGKTVIGLHRAAHLARTGRRVLVTSFIATLPAVFETLFERLAPASVDRVTFSHLQEQARQILNDAGQPVSASTRAADRAFDQALKQSSKDLRSRFPRRYLREEIDVILKARQVQSLEQYIALDRLGRKTAMSDRDKELVWELGVRYQAALDEVGALDSNDILRMAVELAEGPGFESPFDAVIVDEAQDLSLLELRLAKALGGLGPDGLLLVGDGQQSLYAGGMRLSAAGIDVAGRSVELQTNYRNTAETLDAALRLVETTAFDDGDEDLADGARVISTIRNGQPPIVVGFTEATQHDEELVAEVERLQGKTASRGDIAVLVPTRRLIRTFVELLDEAGIPSLDLRNYNGATVDKVKVGTYQRSKGLDFKHVLLPRLDDKALVTPYLADDQTAEERWEVCSRELFVAMGRARDTVWMAWVGEPSQVLVEAGLSTLDDLAPPPEPSESEATESGETIETAVDSPVPAGADGSPDSPEQAESTLVPEPASRAPKFSRQVSDGWGSPGVPVLPRVLRESELLPLDDELLGRLGVSHRSELGAAFWDGGELHPLHEDLLTELASAVQSRLAQLPTDSLGTWPSPTALASMPLRSRTSSKLIGALGKWGWEGTSVHFAQMAAIPYFGTKSMLDFLCVLEAIGPELEADAELTVDLESLEDLQAEDWASTINGFDPRYRDLLSPDETTPADAARGLLLRVAANGALGADDRLLAARLVELASRAEQERALPADESLRRIVSSLTKATDRPLTAVLARFALHDGVRHTLQQAGEVGGFSGQRAQQLCKPVNTHFTRHRVWVPSLLEINDQLASLAPIKIEEASAALVGSGLLTEPIEMETIVLWMELTHVDPLFEILGDEVRSLGASTQEDTVASRLVKLARPFGFVNMESAVDDPALRHLELSAEEVTSAAISREGLRISDEWIWIPTTAPAGVHPLVHLAQKVRVAAGRRFTTADLRHSLLRRARFYGSSHGKDVQVPSTAALANLCRAHDAFDIDQHFRVDVVIPNGSSTVLSLTETAIFDAIEGAPGFVLPRAELVNRATTAGVTRATLEQYLTYGPIVEQVETNVWTLVGRQVSDEHVRQLRGSVRRQSSTLCEWAGDDVILLTTKVTNPGSHVGHVPTGFQPYLADKEFSATDGTGHDYGRVVINSEGQTWGAYSRFLSRSGAEVGDFIETRFDLEQRTAVMSLAERRRDSQEDQPPAAEAAEPATVEVLEPATEVEAISEIGTDAGPQLEGQALEAVRHRGSHMQIIAAAGSGKTEVVSQRVADLLAGGVAADTIVAFTFTEPAAAELKQRIETRVAGRLGAGALDGLNGLSVGTMHAYCFRLLQQHVPRFETYDVLDDHRLTAFLSREANRLGIRELDPDRRLFKSIAAFLASLDVVDNELIDPAAVPDRFGEVLRDFNDTLDRYRLVTYGQQIRHAVAALETSDVAEEVCGNLAHLIVDEYQDVNPAQERLIELLVGKGAELCVVGDDDQAIYQWRGSAVSNIVTFAERYAPVASFTIARNRRSRPAIIDVANGFAQSIPNRLPKQMDHARDAPDNGEAVAVWAADDEEQEAGWIADLVLDLADEGVPYRDIAVLIRSRAAYPRLKEHFATFDIPMQPGGRTALFEQPEAAVLAKMFCWLSSIEWRPPRGASIKVELTALLEEFGQVFGLDAAHQNRVKQVLRKWQAMVGSEKRVADLVGELYELLEVLEVADWDLEDRNRLNSLGTLARFTTLLADYEAVRRRARPDVDVDGEQVGGQDRGSWYYKNLAIHIVNHAQGAFEGFDGEPDVAVDAVDISTIHRAKGLEWPAVFVPSMTKKRFPSFRTGREQDWLLPRDMFDPARYEGSDADERRLFYVAATRARDWLSVSRHERVTTQRVGASPYWEEIDEHAVDPGDISLPDFETSAGNDDEELRLSFSDLSSFLECGRAYRLRNLLGFQPRLAPELGYGKAVHHVLRQLAEATKRDGAVPDSTQLDALMTASFFLPTANKPAHRQLKDAARRLLTTYTTNHADDLLRVWETERPFELHLHGVTVAGRADVILDQEGGSPDSLAIVDYKTSTQETIDPYALQLQVYADAGRREGLEVRAAFVHDLKESKRESVSVDEAAIAKAEETVVAAAERIRVRDFAPSPGDRCRVCEVRTICDARPSR